ncbi:MAG: hypothetical protein EOO89_03645 [Pedobacter sp.]|nr:MAG: hypothetical protein EOO89_03645 [Pedobacter sp.]
MELDRKQPKKPLRMYAWMSAAASVVIVFGLVWMYTARTKYSSIEIADVDPAYARKEIKFVSQIEVKRDSLKTFAKSDPELYEKFSSDLVMLDTEYEKLKKELLTTPNQQFVVRAMVKNREMQLQILQQQLNVINQVNQYKNEKENTL